MPTLKVFGPLTLVNDNDGQMLECSPLALLVAAYVVLKHGGEASREAIRETFYPLEPQAPATFSPIARDLYVALWACGKTHDKHNNNPLRTCVLPEAPQSASNREELTAAHAQLKECGILSAVNREGENWIYELHPKFSAYLHTKVKIKNNEAEGHKTKQEHRHKTFSANLTALRTAIKTVVTPDQAEELIPSGRSGEDKEKLIIRLPSNVPHLQQALREADFEQIKQIYLGPFLENIEKRLRGDIWLSPEVYLWLRDERWHYAHLVSETLEQIIRRSEAEEYELARQIQEFCGRCGIEDVELQNMLAERLERMRSETICGGISAIGDDSPSPGSIFIHTKPSEQKFFPAYLRNYLLAKIQDDCRWLPQASTWFETDISLTALRQGVRMQPAKMLQAASPTLPEVLLQESLGFGFVLGGAGMGKTLLLYRITQLLLEQAKKDKEQVIPLLFTLADRPTANLSFEAWLKYQLQKKLGLPEQRLKSDESFIQIFSRKHCLLLLDGFDNLPPRERPYYLQAMNRFIQAYGESELGGLLVSSRPEEYVTARAAAAVSDFRFFAEAEIQPLGESMVGEYIHQRAQNPENLCDALEKNKEIKHLADSPLGLTLLLQHEETVQAYHEFSDLYQNLIARHIQACFKENKPEAAGYTQRQIYHWLAGIAKSLAPGGIFHLEQLSPEMLENRQRKNYERLFILLFGVIFGLMAGAVSGLIFGDRVAAHVISGQTAESAHLLPAIHHTLQTWSTEYAIAGKLGLVTSYGLLGALLGILAAIAAYLTASKRARAAVFLSVWLMLFMGLTGWLMDGDQWSLLVVIWYGILGVAFGMMTDPEHLDPSVIRLQREARLDYRRLFTLHHVRVGLLLLPLCVALMWGLRWGIPSVSEIQAIFHGLAFGVGFTLVYMLYRAQIYTDWREKLFYPAQKFHLALHRAARMTLFTGLVLTALLSLLTWFNLDPPGNLSFGLRVGFLLAILLGFLFYGGAELLKHAALRWILYRAHLAPLRYEPFLEYAKHTGLLLPRGEGYAFRHEWFQEYFGKKK